MWAKHNYNSHLQEHPKFGLQLKKTILTPLPKYKAALSDLNRIKFEQYGNIGLFGDPLYELLRQAKPNWETHGSIQIVWENAKAQRNSAFHTIEGLQKNEVFKAWNTENVENWTERVLDCLNFVTDQQFTQLDTGSLMVRVHEELKEAIAQL